MKVVLELLKKVVLARIEEIIELAFRDINIINDYKISSTAFSISSGDASFVTNVWVCGLWF